MPGRSLNLGEYRFGFQNQETDPEIYGTGNAVSYKYRVEDVRLGRFLSIDPLAAKYPFYSPYAFSGNRVLDAVELEGLEPFSIKFGTINVEYSANAQGGMTPLAAIQDHFHAGIAFDQRGNYAFYSSYGGFGDILGRRLFTDDGQSGFGGEFEMGLGDISLGDVEVGWSWGIDNVWDFLNTTDWTTNFGNMSLSGTNLRSIDSNQKWDPHLDGLKISTGVSIGLEVSATQTTPIGVVIIQRKNGKAIGDAWSEALSDGNHHHLQNHPGVGQAVPMFVPVNDGLYRLQFKSQTSKMFDTGVDFYLTDLGYEDVEADNPKREK